MKIRLEYMRKKRNLSQYELARRSSVPQPMISMIERGGVASPRVDTLYKLARALKCTVDDLIESDEQKEGA